jgi:hypothetical protein
MGMGQRFFLAKKEKLFLRKREARKKITFWGSQFCIVRITQPTQINTTMNAHFSSSPTPVTAGLAVQRTSRRSTRLSARQLLDVELGLFLLSQLLPTAPPDALPGLLRYANPAQFVDLTWTPQQQKLRSRGLALLTHLTQHTHWQNLLETYMAVPVHLQAYDISHDRTGFCLKTVGFSRNRLTILRKVLG